MSWEVKETTREAAPQGPHEMRFEGIYPPQGQQPFEGDFGEFRVAKFVVTSGEHEGKEQPWFLKEPEGGALSTHPKSNWQKLHVLLTGQPYSKDNPPQFDEMEGVVGSAFVGQEGDKLKLMSWQAKEEPQDF